MSNSLVGRKVRILRCHTPVHVLGVGQIGPAIDENAAKLKGSLTMFMVDNGVLLTINGVDTFISNGNIITAQLFPAELAEASAGSTVSKLFKKS